MNILTAVLVTIMIQADGTATKVSESSEYPSMAECIYHARQKSFTEFVRSGRMPVFVCEARTGRGA